MEAGRCDDLTKNEPERTRKQWEGEAAELRERQAGHVVMRQLAVHTYYDIPSIRYKQCFNRTLSPYFSELLEERSF